VEECKALARAIAARTKPRFINHTAQLRSQVSGTGRRHSHPEPDGRDTNAARLQ
jgi:hypothetical protein